MAKSRHLRFARRSWGITEHILGRRVGTQGMYDGGQRVDYARTQQDDKPEECRQHEASRRAPGVTRCDPFRVPLV